MDNKRSFDSLRDFIPEDSVDSLVLERNPSFEQYLFFHNLLDKLCWCAKLHYSDREVVKRKRYRLDVLLQQILSSAGIGVEKAQKCVKANSSSQEKLEYHLMKGWLNELVRSHPLHQDYLSIGTSLSRWDAPGAGGFASWNIVQSYYAFYEFMATICIAVDPETKVDGHKVVAKAYNNHVIGKASGKLVFYPFGLSSSTNTFPDHPKHSQFWYASYPREMGRRVNDLEYEIVQAYKMLSSQSSGKRTSILDLLYQLRVWSNYTGVQSVLDLSDGGYQKFLSQNLGTLVFLAGSMAEIAYIATCGQQNYILMLRRFATSYIDKHEAFARNRMLAPPIVRLRIFKHLGVIAHPIDLIVTKPIDPIIFIQ
jgi:hypothetical protein